MPIDWRTAYAEQAKSDYAMFIELTRRAEPLCHQLHYLQMATEKLAKAYLTERGGERYPKVHNAFVKFMRVARSMPSIRDASGFTG